MGTGSDSGTEARLERLLDELRTPGADGSFHRAAPGAPAVVSAWDSAHAALAQLTRDPSAACAELETLYAFCGRDDGLLAAERALDAEAAEQRAGEIGEVFGPDGKSVLICPPVAAYAAARVASLVGEPARALLERSGQHLDAIWGERLPRDTPLPVILHPLEAGTHGSPAFAELVEATDALEWLEDTATLVRSAVACQTHPDRALRAGHPFVVEDPLFCGWFLLALEESLRAWEKLGGADTQLTKLRIRIEMIARGIVERLWWDAEEIFTPVDRARQKPIRALTLAGLLPAACRSVVEDGEAKRALERHLRPGVTPLWGTHGISFNPIARDIQLDPTEVSWRGNAVSPLTHFWAHLILMNARRLADARAARSQLQSLIESSGPREFYDAVGREGYGHSDYLGAALVLEMQAREEG
jgi:hypothetical protein